MKRLLLIAVAVLACVLVSLPAAASTFVNGGFENGDFSGWTQGSGYWYGGWPMVPSDYLPGGVSYNPSGCYPSGCWASAVVGPGFDPISGLNTVYNGNFAARINDSYNNYSVNVISQTVNNYTDPHLYFEWAAVLQASHGPTDSDNFTLQVTDLTTNTVLLTRAYNSATNGSIFNYNSSNGWFWTPWQVESIDTSGIVGDDIQLTLLGSDCPYGGHAGYVYLDGFGSVIVPPGAVPEPASLVLMGSGLLGLAYKLRRHK